MSLGQKARCGQVPCWLAPWDYKTSGDLRRTNLLLSRRTADLEHHLSAAVELYVAAGGADHRARCISAAGSGAVQREPFQPDDAAARAAQSAARGCIGRSTNCTCG